MHTVFIVGTAGSGKSTLTSSFSDWLKEQEQSTLLVNLDPAAYSLPYEPDVDVRDYVDYERLMVSRRLGPNAALIASVREVARHVEEIAEEVKSFNPDFVIVDTPGQLELFAFRREGLILSKSIGEEGRKTMLFLLDPMFCTTTKNFVANMFLTASIYLSFNLPMIQVVNKIDAVSRDQVERIGEWADSLDILVLELENSLEGGLMAFSREVAQAVYDIAMSIPMIFISSKTMEGFSELHAALTRIVSEGELELR